MLSKWARRSGENFCTDALAWILETDLEARRTFLEACLATCRSTQSRAHSTIAALIRSDSVHVTTQRRVLLDEEPTRWVQPDLWIESATTDHCMLVEIKVWATATMRRRSMADDEADDEDHVYVPQTAEYRRWLDRHRRGTGALIALTVSADQNLAAECDGSFTWEHLHSALIGSRNMMTKQLCSYLEDVGMVTKQFSLGERELVAGYAVPAWEALLALLGETAKQLVGGVPKAKIMGKPYISMYPNGDGLLLWSRWLRLRSEEGTVWITPYLRLGSSKAGTTLDFIVGLSGVVELKQILQLDRSLEASDEGDEILVTLRVRDAFKGTTRAQASRLVTAARSRLIDPLFGE